MECWEWTYELVSQLLKIVSQYFYSTIFNYVILPKISKFWLTTVSQSFVYKTF